MTQSASTVRRRIRLGRRASAAALATILTAGVLSACSSPVQQAQHDTGPVGRITVSRTMVSPTTNETITVGGAGGAQLAVTVAPGDFASAGAVSVSEANVSAPLPAHFIAAGAPQELAVTGTLARPLHVTFSGPAAPNRVPVVLHFDGRSWNVVGTGPAGGEASAERSTFSPVLGGWLDLSATADAFTTAVKNWAVDGTNDVVCTGTLPPRVIFTPAPLDILKACAGTIADRVQVKMSNNRGLVYGVGLGQDPALGGDVDGQPALLREAINGFVGHQIALLPPGRSLTLALARPDTTQTYSFQPELSPFSLLVSVIGTATGYPNNPEGVRQVAALMDVAECTGLRDLILAGMLPKSLPDVSDLLTQATSCLGSLLTNPKVLTQVAYQVVSYRTGSNLDMLKADPANNAVVEEAGGKLAQAAVALKALLLFKEATVVYRAIGEELGRGLNSGGVDPATLSLTFSARTQAPAALPVLAQTQANADALATMFLKYPTMGVLDSTYDSSGVSSCEFLDVLGADLGKGNLDVVLGLSGDAGCPGDPASELLKIRNGKVLVRTSNNADGCGERGLLCSLRKPYGSRTPTIFSLVFGSVQSGQLQDAVLAPSDIWAEGPPQDKPLVGQWSGHTRGLTVFPSGLAYETIGDGCCSPVVDLTYQLTSVTTSGATTTAHAIVLKVVVHPGYTSEEFPTVGQDLVLTLRNGVISEGGTGTIYCDDVAGTNGDCGA